MVTNVPFHSFAMLPSSKQQHHRHEENCWETFCQYPIFKVSLSNFRKETNFNGIHQLLIADTFHLGYFWSWNGHLLRRSHHCGETSSPENAK